LLTRPSVPVNRIAGFLLLLLAGCSDTQRFSFEGASSDFCVPNDYVVEGPIWLTPDMVEDDGGLAFRGCGVNYRGPCDLPLVVSGGTLSPIAHARFHTWADLFQGAEPRERVLRALRDHGYRVIPDESPPGYQILAIPNPSMGATAVDYWRVRIGSEPVLEPSSQLLAECDGVNDRQPSDLQEVAYGCSRTVITKDASILYRFWNGTVNTAFVSGLDEEVASSIDKWRCKKHG
jgi:hypothetical protein